MTTVPFMIDEELYKAARELLGFMAGRSDMNTEFGRMSLAHSEAIVRSWEAAHEKDDLCPKCRGRRDAVFCCPDTFHSPDSVKQESAAPDAGEITTENLDRVDHWEIENHVTDVCFYERAKINAKADIIANVDRATAGLRERVKELEKEKSDRVKNLTEKLDAVAKDLMLRPILKELPKPSLDTPALLEQLYAIVDSHVPTFPGDTISHTLADELQRISLCKRDEDGNIVATQLGVEWAESRRSLWELFTKERKERQRANAHEAQLAKDLVAVHGERDAARAELETVRAELDAAKREAEGWRAQLRRSSSCWRRENNELRAKLERRTGLLSDLSILFMGTIEAINFGAWYGKIRAELATDTGKAGT